MVTLLYSQELDALRQVLDDIQQDTKVKRHICLHQPSKARRRAREPVTRHFIDTAGVSNILLMFADYPVKLLRKTMFISLPDVVEVAEQAQFLEAVEMAGSYLQLAECRVTITRCKRHYCKCRVLLIREGAPHTNTEGQGVVCAKCSDKCLECGSDIKDYLTHQDTNTAAKSLSRMCQPCRYRIYRKKQPRASTVE
jgi:hypothetical protein